LSSSSIGDNTLKFLGPHPGMRGGDHLEAFTRRARRDRLPVTFQHGLERLRHFPLGMIGAQDLDAVYGEGHLNIHGLLAPECAIVVERGDPLGDRDEVRTALGRDAGDEVDDRPFRRAWIPGREGIVGDGLSVPDCKNSPGGEEKRSACSQAGHRHHSICEGQRPALRTAARRCRNILHEVLVMRE
jgi:hypothetical protein